MSRLKVEVRDDGSMVAPSEEGAAELKRRSGAYEVLPSRQDSVVLKRCGSDSVSDFWVSGEITHLGGLWGLLGVAAHTGWRGELVVAESSEARR